MFDSDVMTRYGSDTYVTALRIALQVGHKDMIHRYTGTPTSDPPGMKGEQTLSGTQRLQMAISWVWETSDGQALEELS